MSTCHLLLQLSPPLLSSISSHLHPNLLHSPSSPCLSSSSSLFLSPLVNLLHFPIPLPPHFQSPLRAYPFPISSFILLHCPPSSMSISCCFLIPPLLLHLPYILFLHHLPSNLLVFLFHFVHLLHPPLFIVLPPSSCPTPPTICLSFLIFHFLPSAQSPYPPQPHFCSSLFFTPSSICFTLHLILLPPPQSFL
ncbi:hypothetical protein Nmel_014871 [Mimus melanotis]